MESSDVYRLLVLRIRRGMIILPVLVLITIVIEFAQFFIPGGRPFGIAAFLAFLAGVCLKFFYGHVRKRNADAWHIAYHPYRVDRAQPMNWIKPVAEGEIWKGEFLMLYLFDGTEFEVGLPVAEMQRFVNWLHEVNPSVQWGRIAGDE